MGERDDQAFDFDEWMALAKSDPAAFEAHRQEAIEKFVCQGSAHRERRLRRTQWRVERERERCGNSLSACLHLQTMMWNSIHADKGLLWALELLSRPSSGRNSSAKSAKILAFKPRERISR